jgi:hypothetical protein
VLRAEPDVFGRVASGPTVSRLVDVLAAAGPKALTAIRTARAEVRTRVRELAGEDSPAADGGVIVDIDGVLVFAHCEKQDGTATWKKTFGHHSLVASVDHGQAGLRGTGGRPAAGPATPAPTPRAITSPPPNSPWPNCPNTCGGDAGHGSAPTPSAAPTPSSTGCRDQAGGCRIPSA